MLSVMALLSFTDNAKAIDIPSLDIKKEKSDIDIPKIDDLEKIKVTDIDVVGSQRKASIKFAILMKVGDYVTPSQIKEDLQRIYGLGWFKENLTAGKEPYLDGFRVIFNVTENPILKKVTAIGNTIVKAEKIEGLFNKQLNKILDYNDARESLDTIKKIYTDQGYEAVSVTPQLKDDGSIDLLINEGIIEDIKLEGNTETRPDIIMREVRLKKGDVLNFEIFRDDLRRIYNTNFFETVDRKFEAGEKNKNHIILKIVVKEKSTGSVNMGAGYNTRDGIVGTFSISKSNVFGTGQNISAELQAGAGWLGTTGSNYLGKLDWFDPWFLPQYLPARTGVGASVYRTRQGNFFQNISQFSSKFDTGNALYNYIMINDRTGLSFNFSRALFGDPLTSPWRLAFSVRAERVEPSIPRVDDVQIKFSKDDKGNNLVDKDNKPTTVDKSFNDLKNSKIASEKDIAISIENNFKDYTENKIKKDLPSSNKGYDDRFALGLSFSYDTRDFAAEPHDGWNNSLSVEPSFGDISYWKFFGTFNKYIPVPYLDKWTLALGVRGGYLLGTGAQTNLDSSGKVKPLIPVYERFYSGSFDTIRGWPEFGYMSGESSVVGSAELRFPIFNILSGVAFIDAGNFWDKNLKITKDNIKTDAADGEAFNNTLLNQFIRYGYGLGLRLNTPLGALRADYGIRDITQPFNLSKGAQFHFSIGQKF